MVGSQSIRQGASPRRLNTPAGTDIKTSSKVSRELLSAYEATCYRVDDVPERFCLRIGQPSERLVQLLEQSGCHCAAFISACNPYSEPHSDEANARAHTQLKQALTDRSVPLIEGAGRDPSGEWPEEKSVLAMGLSKQEACQVAEDFKQNAIVWIGKDGIPSLVLLR